MEIARKEEMKVMNGMRAVDGDGSDGDDVGNEEEEVEVEAIEDPKEDGHDDGGDEHDDGEVEDDDEEGDKEEEEDDDEVENVNPPSGTQDMGTKYFAQPVGRAEDVEDASNFKPGDFKKSMMKVIQYMWISVCLYEQLEWQELHYPILHLIMEKLPFPDFIRSAGVCSWWRQAQRTSSVRPRPRLPWLINKDSPLTETHTIFKYSGMSHDIDIPGTRSANTIGCAYGWLLYEYQGGVEHFLLNHFTSSRIELPGSFPVKYHRNVSHAVISADPSTTDLKMVIIMFMANNVLIFCRPSDSRWSTIESGEPYTYGPNFMADMIACNGKIYVLTEYGKFGCISISYNNCGTVDWLINEDRGGTRWPEEDYCRARYLVESLGDILLVLAYDDLSFKIYKANLERKTWIDVPDLGDRILFLGRCCSLSASDPELTCGKKIYLGYSGDHKKRMNQRNIVRFPGGLADKLWTWKLVVIHSRWHWMLPSC